MLQSKVSLELNGHRLAGERVDLQIGETYCWPRVTDDQGAAVFEHSESGTGRLLLRGNFIQEFEAPGEVTVSVPEDVVNLPLIGSSFCYL